MDEALSTVDFAPVILIAVLFAAHYLWFKASFYLAKFKKWWNQRDTVQPAAEHFSEPVTHGRWSGQKVIFTTSDGQLKEFYTNEFGEPLAPDYAESLIQAYQSSNLL
jgi:predicted acylesterase/phospholipase RssA